MLREKMQIPRLAALRLVMTKNGFAALPLVMTKIFRANGRADVLPAFDMVSNDPLVGQV